MLNKIGSSLSWQSISVIFQAFAQLVLMAVLARSLSAEEFGLIAAANIIILFLQMISEAGVGQALIQKENLDEGHIQASITITFALGLVFFFFVYLSAEYIENFFEAEQLKEITQALSVSFIFYGLSKIPESLLQREFHFKQIFKINSFSVIFGYLIPALVFVNMGYGVWAIVYAVIIQIVIKTILLYMKRPISFSIKVQKHHYYDLMHFGMGMTLIKCWNYIIRQGDRFIIGKSLSSSFLGEYHLASQLAFMPGQYLGDVLDGVFFPVMSKFQSEKDKLLKVYIISSGFSIAIMSSIGFFFASNSKALVLIVFGDKWGGIVVIFGLLSLGAMLRAATRVSDVLNRSQGVVYKSANRKMIVAVCVIVFTYLGVKYQLTGVGVAILLANLMAFYLGTKLSCVSLNINFIALLYRLRYVYLYVSCSIIINLIWWEFGELYILSVYLQILISALMNAILLCIFSYAFLQKYKSDIEKYAPEKIIIKLKKMHLLKGEA